MLSIFLGLEPYLYTAPGQDYSIRVWPRDDPAAERLLKGPREGVDSIAIDATGRLIAAGSRDRGLYVWDFRPGTLLHRQELCVGARTMHFLDVSRLLVADGSC
jgi:WD40 repeat protein